MLIDIHVHTQIFCGPPRPTDGTRFVTPEGLRDMLEPQGVRAAVALPEVNPECSHCIQSVEEVLLAAERTPDFLIPFMNIDPRQNTNSPKADLGHQMRWYKERGCRGVGEVSVNLPFDDPLVENLFRHAEAEELPLTFHIAPQVGGYYGIFDRPGLPLLEGALRKFPGLRFLGHSQPFWAEISGDLREEERGGYPTGPVVEGGAVVRLMREYPNLLGDLSAGSGHNALSRDPEFGYAFLTEFQDRLFFGTDICAPHNETPIIGFLSRAVEEGHISREVHEKVGWRNAERLLGLPPADVKDAPH